MLPVIIEQKISLTIRMGPILDLRKGAARGAGLYVLYVLMGRPQLFGVGLVKIELSQNTPNLIWSANTSIRQHVADLLHVGQTRSSCSMRLVVVSILPASRTRSTRALQDSVQRTTFLMNHGSPLAINMVAGARIFRP